MVFGQNTWICPAAILSHLLQFISDLEIFQLATINEGTKIWMPHVLGDNSERRQCGLIAWNTICTLCWQNVCWQNGFWPKDMDPSCCHTVSLAPVYFRSRNISISHHQRGDKYLNAPRLGWQRWEERGVGEQERERRRRRRGRVSPQGAAFFFTWSLVMFLLSKIFTMGNQFDKTFFYFNLLESWIS
jgi:hypothetical protein